ncbi:hypothetical protein Tco_0774121 [Tanacetum coccineum]|uniref:Transmembrane protein n=1 Tax=Tanacetum coccineum TaxID=301880 RepID=A0ABQ4ZMN9_9ASTR
MDVVVRLDGRGKEVVMKLSGVEEWARWVVGVVFGGGIDELVVVAMVWRWGWWVMAWRVGDDVGGDGRLLDWPEVAGVRQTLREKKEARFMINIK